MKHVCEKASAREREEESEEAVWEKWEGKEKGSGQ